MKIFIYPSLWMPTLGGEVPAIVAGVMLATTAMAQTVVLEPREARETEKGKIQADGSFSFWDDGMLGDWFLAPAAGPISIAIEARGVVAGGSPPLMAVELVSAQGAVQEIARLPIDASQWRTFTAQATVPKGLFGLRLRHLNRTADAEMKVFRHLIVRKVTLTGAERSDMTPAQYLLWGSAGQAASEPEQQGKTVSFETKGLRVAIDPKNARWSIGRKEENGARLDNVAPAFSIADLPVNLAECRGAIDTQVDSASPLGDSTKAILRYEKPGAYEVVYTLWVSKANDEALVQTDFHNLTGKALTIDWIASLASPNVSLGGQAADWTAISDSRANGQPYQLLRLGGAKSLNGWWYLAVKNQRTPQSILLGNLSNNKGSGRFALLSAGGAAIKAAAYNDYERVLMPAGAWIHGEKVLLHFGRRGNDSLERLGDLIAVENKIDLRKDHPIDPYDPARVAIFTGWSSWGASVIEGFPYHHDKEKYKGPSLDPEWRKRNQQAVLDAGLDDYGYASRQSTSNVSAGAPLARNYGHPQDRPTYQIRLAPELQQLHPECYLNNRVDFSNPLTVEYEKKRVADGFAKVTGIARYNWDFTNDWMKLDGQRDPFMTSAETYRLALGLWRDAGRRHPQGAYGLVWMNVVGFNYDRVDVIHIGADSDHGYAGPKLSVTQGLVRQISGRYFYNGKVWWNSPDSYHVFAGGLYTYEQAKVHASFCSIAGNFVQMAEPLAEEQIPPDRLDMIRRVAPATPDTSVAVDVFEHNPAQLWNLPIHRPFGDWNIVGLFNFDYDQKGTPLTQTIDLEKDLLLPPGKEYLAYEYWSRRFLGPVRGKFTRTLSAPDCEILALVEKQDHPLLVSTNRHVRQMAYDIRDMKWDPKGRTLEGVSRVVRNDPYELRLYIPAGYSLRKTEVEGLEAKTKTDGGLTLVSFMSPQSRDVRWKAEFDQR